MPIPVNLNNFIRNFAIRHDIPVVRVLHESDLQVYYLNDRGYFYIDKLVDELSPLAEEQNLHFHTQCRRNAAILAISTHALSESTQETLWPDIVVEDAPTAADYDPEDLKNSVLHALRNVKMDGKPLIQILANAGIRYEWQSSGSGLIFPYLQFYKQDKGGDKTNLFVLDLQTVAEPNGLETAVKQLASLAQNQGVGAIDAAMGQMETLRKVFKTAGDYALSQKLKAVQQPGAAAAATGAAPMASESVFQQRINKILAEQDTTGILRSAIQKISAHMVNQPLNSIFTGYHVIKQHFHLDDTEVGALRQAKVLNRVTDGVGFNIPLFKQLHRKMYQPNPAIPTAPPPPTRS